MSAHGADAPAAGAAPGAIGWRRLRRAAWRIGQRPLAAGGAAFVVLFVLGALLAPLLSPYDPLATNWSLVRKAPTVLHWLGTEELGRDVLARVIWGARASLIAGVCSIGIAIAIGVPLGLVSGYYRGWIDATIMRLTDAWLSFPFLILAIGLMAILGPSLINATLAIGIGAMPIYIRLTRGITLGVREEDFVLSARALGASDARILALHILPNTVSPLVVQATVSIPGAIIQEAVLSFLGLGTQPPQPSWGTMLNAAQPFLESAPWMAIFPGLSIFVVALAFNLAGDGLRDILDPKDYT
jgi:peptide/nickel transport system permease protein